MNNVEKLKQIGELHTIRKRLGADDVADTSCDALINSMSNDELMIEYCAWKLGDGGWWKQFKTKFDKLEKLDRENSCPIFTK